MSDVASVKRCLICGKELLPVFQEYGWQHFQPNDGGEVQFIFSYGSAKFDLGGCEPTVFRGVICDDCAEKLVPQMERVA